MSEMFREAFADVRPGALCDPGGVLGHLAGVRSRSAELAELSRVPDPEVVAWHDARAEALRAEKLAEAGPAAHARAGGAVVSAVVSHAFDPGRVDLVENRDGELEHTDPDPLRCRTCGAPEQPGHTGQAADPATAHAARVARARRQLAG